jgi:hypothetical protein
MKERQVAENMEIKEGFWEEVAFTLSHKGCTGVY